MTRVLNLDTGVTLNYSIPPQQAVVAAFEQARGNWNTWAYPANHSKLRFGPSGKTVSCGPFCAMLQGAHDDTHSDNDISDP